MRKIMIMADIPTILAKSLADVCSCEGKTLSSIVVEGLGRVENAAPIPHIDGDKIMVRRYIDKFAKKKLVKMSRHHKVSIASIVRGIFVQELSLRQAEMVETSSWLES